MLVRGGTVVTMDAERRIVAADVLLEGGRITAIAPGLAAGDAQVIDATGLHVLPGFVQGHTHLGQALLRGLAEGRDLLRWLRERIWPLEAAHDHDSAYWSGMLGAADCLLAGTTTIQDIGIVTHMDAIFLAIEDSGLRAIAGKCLMDTGLGVPAVLAESPAVALDELRALHSRWDGEADGRIHLAVCPRFILSCSQRLWEGAVAISQELSLPMHTHLLEHASEEDEVRALLGAGQLEWLDAIGVLDTPLSIAHGVQFGPHHRELLRGRSLGVIHCPSANLKLGSGIADLQFLRDTPGVKLGIGCDGAPCNNDMDVLEEMRLAALLQGIKAGPGRFAAETALALATIEGARAIGLEHEIGSIEPGKAADLVLLDLERPQSFGAEQVSVYDRIVYAAARDAIAWVLVDGIVRVDHGRLPHVDAQALRRKPHEAIAALLQRAQLD
jgi:5-methylthioadenosine/S-adenosylhomocysteine deaminase